MCECMRGLVHGGRRGGEYLYYMDFGGIPTSQRDGSEYNLSRYCFLQGLGSSCQLVLARNKGACFMGYHSYMGRVGP